MHNIHCYSNLLIDMSMKVVSRYVQNFIVYSGDLNNDHLNNGNI